MHKHEIVGALEETADLMEILGQNTFRVRSFRSGARAIEALDEDLTARVAEGNLEAIPGIGKTLAAIITELVETGGSGNLERLRQEVPPGLVEINRIPGVGPKKAKALYDSLGVASVADLERACREGRIASVKGFGKKTAEKILAGIVYREKVQGRFLVVEARIAGESLLEYLRGHPAIVDLEIAGSLRRRRETVKDVDFIAVPRDLAEAPAVMEHFVSWEGVEDVLAKGETKSSVRLIGGIQADLRVVDGDAFPATLQYFTGSKEHNTTLRALAKERGLKLNEYGLFAVEGDRETKVECRDEAAIYSELGLEWIPPELREDMGEIELARSGGLPTLLLPEDIRGVVHVHTTYSDGQETLEAMAEAAMASGFEYLGVSDHSQSAGYAGGLKVEEIEKQHTEIDRLNERFDPEGFRIFKGIESDIRMDGSLDYPPEVLDRFDFVIAAVHSGFQLPAAEQTARVIRALEDPHTTFLAHPTGRLLLARDGYAIDIEAVLRAAGELGVVVEINAHPRRLDLDWRWGRFARRHHVKTAIHPDAHAVAGYGDIEFGVGVARKAGFEVGDVVNTYSVKDFAEFIGRRR